MSELRMVFQNQKLDKDPSLEKIPVGRYGVVVDGLNLPNTITEVVRGFSLRPSYSARQLRRIERIAKKKADHENIYLMSSQRNNEDFPEWRNLLTADNYVRRHSRGGDLE